MFTIFKGIIDLIVKLLYSLAANWFYLLLAFIAPLTIYYVSQGEEIVRVLQENDENWTVLNLVFVLVSFVVLFYSVWVIPVPSINLIYRFFESKSPNQELPPREKLFSQLAIYYNSRGDGVPLMPVRILANTTLFIFNYMLIVKLWDGGASIFYFFLFLIFSLLVSEYLKRKIQDDLINDNMPWGLGSLIDKPFLGYLGHFYLILIVTVFWFFRFDDAALNYLVKIITLFFIWLFCLWNDLFHKFIEIRAQKDSELQSKSIANNNIDFYKKSRIVYLYFSGFVLLAIIIFSISQYNYWIYKISPIIIMNVGFAFFIGFMDLLIKTPLDILHLLNRKICPDNGLKAISSEDRELMELQDGFRTDNISKVGDDLTQNLIRRIKQSKEELYWFFKFVNLGFTILIVYVLFISSANDHKMRREVIGQNDINSYSDRDSLGEYYSAWKSHNGKPDTVILIAALGGGSRAGYWTGIHLDRIYDSTMVFNSKSKIFAISTVSGGTSGTNMFIAKKGMEFYNFPDSMSNDNFWRNVYGYNYVSSALWGLLFSDGIRGWLDKNAVFDRDRNFCRQQEELRAFAGNYPTDVGMEKSKLFFENDFMWKYQDDQLKYKLPLHFINTATVQSGRRAIIAPVKLDSNYFHNAVDLYQEHLNLLQNSCRKYSFPTATAVNLSQSFPLISAYNYLECVGTFMDGGLWDNTGLNTLTELYSKLISIDSTIKYKLIYISNGESENSSTKKVNSVILQTLGSATTSPFSGHAVYWEKAFKQKRPGREVDSLEHIQLLDSLARPMKIPLGVLLSKHSMDSMYRSFKFKIHIK
ncbi:MAG: hypothetical protein IPH93_16855 [Saprospiraceae bacterium]|nr:hypothetical protein [Saprospiraceae bacterium]MBK7811360.1 hypothetical protein [Saprospiraceae bacterium]